MHQALGVESTTRLSPLSSLRSPESGKSFATSALRSRSRSRAEDDGNRRSVLLLVLRVAHPAAPPTARPPAAAAAAASRRTGRAVAEVAGGGGGRRGSGGGLHEGGHGRRVLPALRHQAHHALRRCSPKTPAPFPSMIPPTLFYENLQSASLMLCVTVCRRLQPLQRGRPVRAGARPQQVNPPCLILTPGVPLITRSAFGQFELLMRSALQLMDLQF